MDEKTDATLKEGRTEILKLVNQKSVVSVPTQYNKMQVSRFMKTSLRNIIEGDYLFLDTDTIVTKNLDEIDTINADVAAVINGHESLEMFSKSGENNKKRMRRLGAEVVDDIKYYSSGVSFVRDTEAAHDFFYQWHRLWCKSVELFNDNYDQPAFNTANEKCGGIIIELDGTWNCQMLSYGLPFFCDAKILHYFASKRQFDAKGCYVFNDKSTYSSIKKDGYLSQQVVDMITNAKSAFINPCRIVNSVENSFLQSDLAYCCVRYPFFLSVFNPIAKTCRWVYNMLYNLKKK